MRTQIGKFALTGDGLCVGYDSEDPVSDKYPKPSEFRGGEIHFVTISVSGTQYLDLEKEARAAFASE
jgi:hypothetical protein